MARIGAHDFAVIQNDDGGGMTFGARGIGKLRPRCSRPILNVVGNKNAAGGRADDTGVHAVGIRRIDCQPEYRMAEIMQRLPVSTLIGRRDDLPIRIRAV
jgi:hypothetical protein